MQDAFPVGRFIWKRIQTVQGNLCTVCIFFIVIVDIEKFFRKSEIKFAKFFIMMYHYKMDLSVKRGGSCSE